ncbi:putative transposase [Lutispora thermophila DSM 19022]|uniref:Putative transposase n=1 Tax=Lutispora thermophila DSM 19022 TaxID=1122184 RepID=A0A1M6IZI5_9FIRM|nr:putative transposase [Lutispora thermophila DSM 19022]
MVYVLHRLNLNFTRPTYTLDKADPQKQEMFKQGFELLKNLLDGKIGHILFKDESMIKDYKAIEKTWFLKSQQKIIPTYGQYKGVKLVGILNYETGKVYCIEEEKYDVKVFLKFLQNVLTLYPTGKIVVVLDNARIHHAKLLESFLLENKDRLQLKLLLPYSPELNFIEGLWKWLKGEVINNVFFPSVDEIRIAVCGFIGLINKNQDITINRLCVRL